MSIPWRVLAAVVVAGGLTWLEWRRADRRNLVARSLATLLAVAALALLGWGPAWRKSASTAGGVEAALWTSGAGAGDADDRVAPGYRFALPGATAAPAGAMVLPDVATWRRRFPQVGTLHVYGDGLEPFDRDTLGDCRLIFTPGRERLPGPAFSFVRCPRELPVGDALVVQGRLAGLAPGTTVTVRLTGPGGNPVEGATKLADANGEAEFSVQDRATPAVGHFLWRLQAGSAGEPLGVAVVAPDLPRVLLLASAPRFDTAALRRWFGRAGGTLTGRTLIGRDRYQFESKHYPSDQFSVIDAPLLSRFDLVLADASALAALAPPERDAVTQAVTRTGLGVLALADDAALPSASKVPPETAAAFFPWKLTESAADPTAAGNRLARVHWPGQALPGEIALPIAPFDIAPQTGQISLMQDGQGHTLAVSAARGRGQIALTLVRETGRWQRVNDLAQFAAYWSELFSRVARKAAESGRWMLPGGDAAPAFVDQPVDLVWLGDLANTSGPGLVMAEDNVEGATQVHLAADPAEPGRAWGTFWPRRAGWHRVIMPGAAAGRATADFYVQAAGSWPALQAARRRAATLRFAASSANLAGATSKAPAHGTADTRWLAGGLFALFLASAGYLWLEQRRSS